MPWGAPRSGPSLLGWCPSSCPPPCPAAAGDDRSLLFPLIVFWLGGRRGSSPGLQGFCICSDSPVFSPAALFCSMNAKVCCIIYGAGGLCNWGHRIVLVGRGRMRVCGPRKRRKRELCARLLLLLLQDPAFFKVCRSCACLRCQLNRVVAVGTAPYRYLRRTVRAPSLRYSVLRESA